MPDGIRQVLDPMTLVRAFGYTTRALRYAATRERAFQQEAIAGIAGVPLAVILGDSGVERALLIGSLLLVLTVELINSAIETIVNRIGSEQHELSGRAKDLGSAAVFITLVNVVVVWALVLTD